MTFRKFSYFALHFAALTLPLAAQVRVEEPPATDAPTAALTPVEIVEKLRLAHGKTQAACVDYFQGGYAAATVISEDGLVLTAGHVLSTLKPPAQKEGDPKPKDKFATLTFPDGTSVKAKPLGYHLVNDTALLQIVSDEKEGGKPGPFPHATLTKKPVSLGDFCYLWSHPAGKKKGRPAQLRLGRITQIQKIDGKPWIYYSDLMIQPGDSGGGIFSLEGELIAVASSAGAIPRLNRFVAIERVEEDRDRLLAGERWGNFDDGPGGKNNSSVSVESDRLQSVIDLFQKRLAAKDRYVTEFVKSAAKDGALEMSATDVVRQMVPEVFALRQGDAISDGLESPQLLAALPFPKDTQLPVPSRVFRDGLPTKTVATRISASVFLAKASEIIPETALEADAEFESADEPAALAIADSNLSGKGWPVEITQTIEEHDLVVLTLTNPAAAKQFDGASVPFESDTLGEIVPVKAGDGLFAIDGAGQPTWGIACDEARAVSKRITKGPFDDYRLSERRAKFPRVISHNLPLFASDAGTPIYDFQGNFIGIHIARHSRTLGLILPVGVIAEVLEKVE